MQRPTALIISVLAGLACFAATAADAAPVVGDQYELRMERKSESKSANGSGSSSDRDTMTVKVLAVGADGVELEYDLPIEATAEDRKRQWQFPARVMRSIDGGTIRLLNAPELEGRVDPWLALGNWNREACGKWIFTWNAFKIECNPQSVLETIAVFDPPMPLLNVGAPYRHPAAANAAPLRRTELMNGHASFSVSMPIDADKVRAQQAESDVVVGQITGSPISPEQAKAARGKMQVNGTIDVTFEVNPAGELTKQSSIYRLETVDADGDRETRVTTEVLTRKRIP